MRPRKTGDGPHGRDVLSILDAGRIGIRPHDNMGTLVTYRHNSDALPIEVSVPTRSEPLSVHVVRVVTVDGDGFRATGNRIGWFWRRPGQLEVSVVDDLNASTDYDVTLWILGGPTGSTASTNGGV